MGYIKLGEFDLVCADNVGDIKLNAGAIDVKYLSQCMVKVENSGSTLSDADVVSMQEAIDMMNGASGKSPRVSLSTNVSSCTMTVLAQATT